MALRQILVGKAGCATAPLTLVQGDSNTQIIQMIVQRYYGGVDLGKLTWDVVFENGEGATDTHYLTDIRVGDVNISCNWKPHGLATSTAGQTKFQLEGYAEDENGAAAMVWQSGFYYFNVSEDMNDVTTDWENEALTDVHKLILYVNTELPGVIRAGTDAAAAAEAANKAAEAANTATAQAVPAAQAASAAASNAQTAADNATAATTRATTAAESAETARDNIQADLNSLKERMPVVGSDPETHYVLEQSDIDVTLSVTGKVADAGVVGEKIGELSEEIADGLDGYVESAYYGADVSADVFASYASSGTMRFCGNRSEVGGKIDSIDVHVSTGAIGKTVTMYIYTLIDGIFKKAASFDLVLKGGVNTYKNGVDFTIDADIPKDSILGIYAPAGSGQVAAYGTDGTNGYNITDVGVDQFSATPNTTYNIALGMTVVVKPVLEKVNEHEERIEMIETGMLEAQKDISALKRNGKSLVLETPNSTQYYVDADTMIIKVRLTALNSNTGIKLCRNAQSTTAASRQDFILPYTGEMGFYKTVGNTSDSSEAKIVVTQQDIGFDMVVGREYLIESIREKGNVATLRITDCMTMESSEITSTDINIGAAWGTRGLIRGNADLIDYHYISTQPYNAKVLIVGDSYIEGNSIWTNKDSRWCALLRDALDGDVFINGQGGASSAVALGWFQNYLFDLCNPKYCILHVGVNDSVVSTYAQNMSEIIALLKEKGVIPVLVKIPPTTGSNSSAIWQDINAWVESSGELYLDECTILTANYDGVTQNTDLFNADLIHPNIEGHQKIFNRIKCDLPMLFHLQ